MRKSVKAALFSALVFPGMGHFLLRRLPAAAACVFIVTYSVERAFDTVDQILTGQLAADTASIEAALKQPPPENQALLLDSASWLILACWLGAAVDAVILGHRLEVDSQKNSTALR